MQIWAAYSHILGFLPKRAFFKIRNHEQEWIACGVRIETDSSWKVTLLRAGCDGYISSDWLSRLCDLGKRAVILGFQCLLRLCHQTIHTRGTASSKSEVLKPFHPFNKWSWQIPAVFYSCKSGINLNKVFRGTPNVEKGNRFELKAKIRGKCLTQLRQKSFTSIVRILLSEFPHTSEDLSWCW